MPEALDNVPAYIETERIYHEESEADESWDYDEKGIKCFSLCIPVCGKMHSDKGVFARVKSLANYIKMLQMVASEDYEICGE